MGHRIGATALRRLSGGVRLIPTLRDGDPHDLPRLSVGVGLYTGQSPHGMGTGGDLSTAPLLARAAEDAGFDAFWVSEHHGWDDGYLPSPLPVLAAASAVTERITLATGVVLAPLRHPVQLAEDAAVVDRLSAGRLLLGMGAGYLRHEVDAVGADMSRRGAAVEEAVEVCRAAWRGQPFSLAGPLHDLRHARVTPTPHDGRQIPIWLGGYAPAAVARARRMADGFLIGRGDAAVVERTDGLLRAQAPPDGTFTVGVNLITVLDEPGSDADGAITAFGHQQAAYERWQREESPYSGQVDVGSAAAGDRPATSLAGGPAASYLHCRGTAAEVAAQAIASVRPLSGWAHVHVVLRALFPETDLGAQLTRLARLGEQVLPSLRAARPG